MLCIKKTKGLTLVELMISMVISSIIMLGVVSVYSSSRKGQKINEAVARVQENLRFAADFMTRDIRMAGYVGCKSNSTSNILDDTDSLPFKFENAVTGFEAGSAFPSQFPAVGTTAGLRVAGTDAIAIVRVKSKGCRITDHKPNAATIDIDAAACGIEKGEIVAITDCKHSAIFAVTGPNNLPANNHINHNTGAALNGIENCSKNLGKVTTPGTGCLGAIEQYAFNAEDTRVHKYVLHAYFIGISTSGNTKSLYVVDLDKGLTSQTELVEGIENLQITYGIDPNLDDDDHAPVRFLNASDIAAADMKKIVSVKFGMLLNSINDAKQIAPTTNKTYSLSGTDITPTADKKLRFVYNTTVKIRNKGAR